MSAEITQNRIAGPRYATRAAQPKFGLGTGNLSASMNGLKLAANAKTLVATKNITETFLWGFVGMDVGGIWVPRIKVSLTRGAIPYDVNQDPEMQDKPLHTKVKKSIIENTKGLNWVNFYEEAGREFATGPGMLIMPTLIYLLSKPYAYGGNSLYMHKTELGYLGANFSHHLKQLDAGHPLKQPATGEAGKAAFLQHYRQEVQKHMVHSFRHDDEALLKKDFGEIIRNNRKTIKAEVAAKLPHLPANKVITGEDYLNAWFKHWTEHYIQEKPISAKELRATSEKMAPAVAELDHIVRDQFNEKFALATKLEKLRKGGQGIQTNVMETGKVHIYGRPVSLGKHIQGLAYASDFLNTVAKEHISGKAGTEIQDTVLKSMGKVKNFKNLFQASAFILSTVYLFTLVQFTQKHNKYPGERLAHLEGEKKAAEPKEANETKDAVAQTQPERILIPQPQTSTTSYQSSPFVLSGMQFKGKGEAHVR